RLSGIFFQAEDGIRRLIVTGVQTCALPISPYGLRWYEEAGDPLDYQLQAKLANHYPGPMATGENLFSLQDARNLIRYAQMRSDRSEERRVGKEGRARVSTYDAIYERGGKQC